MCFLFPLFFLGPSLPHDGTTVLFAPNLRGCMGPRADRQRTCIHLRMDSIDSASAGASVSASAVQQMEPRTEAMSLYLSIYLYLPIYLSICIYAHVYVYAHYILNGKEVQ